MQISVVFIPKCRRKTLYGQLRRDLGSVFRGLAEQKECKVEEEHLMPDHVHMLLSVPPKYSVSSVMGFLKGKSAIHIARVYAGRQINAQEMVEVIRENWRRIARSQVLLE
jgi:putative transposase